MKLLLRESDYLERDHLYGIIRDYMQDNDGRTPEYIIVHPATFHKIIMLTNERRDDVSFQVINYRYDHDRPHTTIYGIAFIRSEDVEPDFVIIT